MNMVSTPIPRQAGGRVLAEVGGNGEQRVMGNYGAGAEQYGWLLETVQHQADGFHDIDRSGKDTGFEIEDYVAKARLNSAEGARFHQQLDVKLQYSEETSQASYLGLSDADFDRDENRRYGLSALDEMTNEHQCYSARYRFEFSEQLGLNLLWYRNEFTRDWFKLDRVNAQSMSGMISAINAGAATAPLYQGWLDGTLDVNNVEIKHNNREYEAEGLQFTLDARSPPAPGSTSWSSARGVTRTRSTATSRWSATTRSPAAWSMSARSRRPRHPTMPWAPATPIPSGCWIASRTAR
jgi:Fe(3+) dicitrate transport protein